MCVRRGSGEKRVDEAPVLFYEAMSTIRDTDAGPQGPARGKPVRIRYGPAAVIGDESRRMPLFHHQVGREGAG